MEFLKNDCLPQNAKLIIRNFLCLSDAYIYGKQYHVMIFVPAIIDNRIQPKYGVTLKRLNLRFRISHRQCKIKYGYLWKNASCFVQKKKLFQRVQISFNLSIGQFLVFGRK